MGSQACLPASARQGREGLQALSSAGALGTPGGAHRAPIAVSYQRPLRRSLHLPPCTCTMYWHGPYCEPIVSTPEPRFLVHFTVPQHHNAKHLHPSLPFCCSRCPARPLCPPLHQHTPTRTALPPHRIDAQPCADLQTPSVSCLSTAKPLCPRCRTASPHTDTHTSVLTHVNQHSCAAFDHVDLQTSSVFLPPNPCAPQPHALPPGGTTTWCSRTRRAASPRRRSASSTTPSATTSTSASCSATSGSGQQPPRVAVGPASGVAYVWQQCGQPSWCNIPGRHSVGPALGAAGGGGCPTSVQSWAARLVLQCVQRVGRACFSSSQARAYGVAKQSSGRKSVVGGGHGSCC